MGYLCNSLILIIYMKLSLLSHNHPSYKNTHICIYLCVCVCISSYPMPSFWLKLVYLLIYFKNMTCFYLFSFTCVFAYIMILKQISANQNSRPALDHWLVCYTYFEGSEQFFHFCTVYGFWKTKSDIKNCEKSSSWQSWKHFIPDLDRKVSSFWSFRRY